MRAVRIFVSSPNDALDERRRVSRVVDRLNSAFRDNVRLEAVRWEERFYSAHDGFQPQIPRSGECDLVLAILRGRLGSPLSAAFHAALPPEERLPDGASYPSGTAYEILSAIQQRQRGSELPDIYVFRWPEPPQVSLDAPDRAEVEAQWQALKRFAEAVFHTDEGHFKGSYQSYMSLDDFEVQVEALLRDWLKTHVLGGRTVLWSADRGSPFRGLEPFGMRHAEVFFGRTGEVARAVGKLKLNAEHGAPFQLVVGPSGAGKSSFVRAGLVPKLIVPGEVDGVGAWRVALMRPGESPEGPMAALARRLFEGSAEIDPAEAGRPAALPELSTGAFATPEALTHLLAHADETSVAPILAALAKVAEAEQEKWGAEKLLPARLLLVVDQLDDIFAAAITDAQRAGFGHLLEELGRTGVVWVVATLRAELYDVFLKSPLRVIAAGDRTFTLQPPVLAEMAEIVREPARAANLSWESDPETGKPLDERLLIEVDRPNLLPLLQFVLERLYEKREGGSDGQPLRLTFAAYRELGTLDDAIRAEAERAFKELGAAEQAALPRLLRGLVIKTQSAISAAPEIAALTLRAAPIKIVAPSEAGQRLVAALRDARLLVTGQGKDKEPTVELAHQRVIEAWDRARAIVAENTLIQQVAEGIALRRRDWEKSDRPSDLLLPRGVLLARAEEVMASYDDELDNADRQYVRNSRRYANRWKRRSIAAVFVFFLISVCTVYAGFANKNTIDRLYVQVLSEWAKAYENQNDETNALKYYMKSIDYGTNAVSKGNTDSGLVVSINTSAQLVGSYFETKKQYDDALVLFKLSLSMISILKNDYPGNREVDWQFVQTEQRIGRIKWLKEDFVESCEYYHKSMVSLDQMFNGSKEDIDYKAGKIDTTFGLISACPKDPMRTNYINQVSNMIGNFGNHENYSDRKLWWIEQLKSFERSIPQSGRRQK